MAHLEPGLAKNMPIEHREETDKKFGDDHENVEALALDSTVGEFVDPTLVITPAQNKALRRKLYWRILPVMGIAYITQSLDKGTLGTSSIMGWQADTGAVGQDYALTSTLLWIGIVTGEPLVNQLVRRLPVAKILGISMFVWTGLVFAIAFTLHVPSIFAIRFFLGLFESSFSPCLVAITVQWFTAEEQTMITTVWQSMLGFATVISSLLAYGLVHLPRVTKGLYTWQWLNIIIASISGVASAIVFFFLPDTPMSVKWATAEEKTMYIERVRRNDQGIKQKKWRSDQAWECLKDPLPIMLFGMNFFSSCIGGGIGTFSNLLINQAFGFNTETSLLLNLGISAFQITLYYVIGWIGTVTKQTCFTICGAMFINLCGTIVLITVAPGPNTKVGLLIAFLAMQCITALNPSHFAMLSRNIAGQTKKSIVYAIFLIGWAAGNAVGPLLFQSQWAPRYTNTLYIHVALYCLYMANALGIRYFLKKRNETRDRLFEERGEVNRHAHAFDDLTDIQNVEYRYMY